MIRAGFLRKGIRRLLCTMLIFVCVQGANISHGEVRMHPIKNSVNISCGDDGRTYLIDIEVFVETHNSLEDNIDKEAVTAVYFIDPRFVLTAYEGSLETTDVLSTKDGSTRVSWNVEMPKSRGNARVMELEIRAKDDFIGGNDIPISDKFSGIYQYGKMIGDFQICMVNVPLTVGLENIETQIFMGQAIPLSIDGTGIEEKIIKNPFQWYNREPTGRLAGRWENKNGKRVGATKQLKEYLPYESATYRYILEFIPESYGINSIGEPVGIKRWEAEYRVNVVSGSVRVLYALADKAELWNDSSYALLKLSGSRCTKYAAVRLADRNEDGEHVVLEAVFENLPYGIYSVTQVYSYTDAEGSTLGGVGGEVCVLGLMDNSDIIDMNETEDDVYIMPNRN